MNINSVPAPTPLFPASPLAQKRARLGWNCERTIPFVEGSHCHSTSTEEFTDRLPAFTSHEPFCDHVETPLAPAFPFPSPPPPSLPLPAASPISRTPSDSMLVTITSTLQDSMDELELRSHNVRREVATKQQADKGTSKSYSRHLKNYLTWWSTYQQEETRKNPVRIPIAAEPIMVAKVAMFLQHEISRPKRKRGSNELQEGTTLGKSAISQAISALEYHRSENAHLYKHDREAQVPLRSDKRIRMFEEAAKHNEPRRIEQSQALKASGTSAGMSCLPIRLPHL
ncbi:hypothetical protein K474DRAFT_1606805 [Panus rudis PR-1116 ss-1]|nr:hypothetical protein K474DRAFT_1606805 [Panus rudis PR-1116 ss-1]